MSSDGLGEVRPRTIDFGGNSTGVVDGVSWSTWGGVTAQGRGTASFVPAGQANAGGIPTRATVRAYGLTTCDGHPAYRNVTWWFPSKGETLKSVQAAGGQTFNLCNES